MSKTHVVKRTECLSSIAKHYGLANWRSIYDDPLNSEFRKRRPNPNVIRKGDRILIPDRTEHSETVGTEDRHRFVKKGLTTLRIRLLGEDGTGIDDCDFRLDFQGQQPIEGATDQDGLIDEHISADLSRAELFFWPKPLTKEKDEGIRWRLEIGQLDPLECLSGVQARLNNLGFDSGRVDGKIGPVTRNAIKRFQQRSGLKVSGKVDDELRESLELWHDGMTEPTWENEPADKGS